MPFHAPRGVKSNSHVMDGPWLDAAVRQLPSERKLAAWDVRLRLLPVLHSLNTSNSHTTA